MSVRLVEAEQTGESLSEKDRLIGNLKLMLEESFRLRRKGGAHSRFAHAQGYADGYMKLMLDSGLVSQRELLAVVIDARRGVDGPATGPVSSASSEMTSASA